MGSYISTETPAQAGGDGETKEMEDFLSVLPSQHLEPLWSQMNVMVPPNPNPTAKAHMWKYAEALPHLQKAGALVPEERAERRVLMLVNPSMQSPYTTDTIYGGLQLVNPGETAPAHRHLAFACRFIIDGEGFTAVEGKKMPLVRGDVVTTPIWHWHDHGNESREPVIWLDMLNLPLFRFAPVHFAEGYADPRYPSTPCDPCEWRHPWAPVEEALNAAAGPHAVHHYRNADGRPLSTTLGVQAERLAPGAEVESRDSCSYIYHCYEGTGRTEVETPAGEKSVFRWTARDTFAVPAWSSVRHVNESQDERAYLVACHDARIRSRAVSADVPVGSKGVARTIVRRTTSIYRQRNAGNANMAEIVGLVASSIALAEVVGKVGGGILKLKRMWDEVKDVPESIQDLFKRLDLILRMVARIARDIETGATVFEDMEAVESCILCCQQVISDEATMMNDLIVQIDATKRKLEGMIQILILADSEYTRACTKAIPRVIVQHLTDLLDAILQNADSGYSPLGG
ncbi:Gentisate 1 like protein [Verticillium longisporum]|uniref:Gentisate 1 like protein n=1 Tax=Verticillium longisporum TaxID=100787 RepID=A0A8I3AYU7_VERLO|nr:Gentisate 1 like protein [Verticillium longisporum]